MFPLAIPIAAGGLLGALTRKKDPLTGALIGAGLGAVGGQFAPGLLGAGGGGAATVAQQAAAPVSDAVISSVAPEAASMSLGTFMNGPASVNLANSGVAGMTQAAAPVMDAVSKPVSGGLLSGMNATVKEYAPLANAAGTGLQVAGLLKGQPAQAPQTPAPMQVTGNQTLASLANSGTEKIANDLAMQNQLRAQRRQMWRG